MSIKSALAKSPPLVSTEQRDPLWIQRILESLDQANPLPDKDESPSKYQALIMLVHAAIKGGEYEPLYSQLQPALRSRLELLQSFVQSGTLPAQSAENPYQNLGQYASLAILPALPWSHYDTTTQAGERAVGDAAVEDPDEIGRYTTSELSNNARALQNVRILTEFLDDVMTFTRAKVPNTLVTNKYGRIIDRDNPSASGGLSVNAWGLVEEYQYLSFNIPESRSDVCRWLECLPLRTAARTMHVMESETLPYKYIKLAVKESSDKRSLVYYAWEEDPVWFRLNTTIAKMFANEAPVEPRRRILIGVSTPWQFQIANFDQVCSLGGLPNAAELGAQPELHSRAEATWAEIYDISIKEGTFFFVLTTYDYWAFGAFALDYQSATISKPVPYDHVGPTVVQCLLYWTHLATLPPQTNQILAPSSGRGPVPSERVYSLRDATIYDPQAILAIMAAT